jgi:hypothetical protein
MAFYDDSGIDDSARGPLWGAFATLRDQIERLVLLNLAWSLQLLPAVIALGFGGSWPWLLRAVLVGYSALAVVPVSALVYALVARAVDGEHLGLDVAAEALRRLAAPSMRALAPLYGALVCLMLLGLTLEQTLLAALAQLLLLCGLLLATYWGPLLVETPQAGPIALLQGSLRLTLRYPGGTLLTFGATLLCVGLGAISIGGLFLIAFVLIALLQTHMLRFVRSIGRP